MDLHLVHDSSKDYTSGSQISKSLTEKWFAENMYCPACTSDTLDQKPPNEKVVDFICPKCEEKYQLKGMAHGFGNRIVDSAYEPKIKMIKDGTAPNFVFLRYDAQKLMVQDMMMVPKHFLVPEVIEKRPPLKVSARRAGWVGSNILLGKMPVDARLYIVQEYRIVQDGSVREAWKRFEFLKDMKLESRGWLNDVLAVVRKLGKTEFSLKEIYAFEKELSKLHPENFHVKAKIRQQLQVLRKKSILVFIAQGQYALEI